MVHGELPMRLKIVTPTPGDTAVLPAVVAEFDTDAILSDGFQGASHWTDSVVRRTTVCA